MKKLKPLVPALLSFGPILMVIGLVNSQNIFSQISAYVGAIMLSLGCLYLYKSQNI